MPLAFHKYHGCANDFVLLDLVAEPAWSEVDLAAASPFLCDRRRGIGADQVLVLEQGDSADSVAMRIFNADGSAAGMCGNGLRCAARHARERMGRAANPVMIEVRFAGGVRPCPVTLDLGPGGDVTAATVDMGVPAFEPTKIPTLLEARGGRVINVPLPPDLAALCAASGASLEPLASCVSMGNPHLVLFGRRPTPTVAASLGAALEVATWFPERVNVHFCEVHAPDRVSIISWERGAGLTPACGSGACASVVVAATSGRTGADVAVDMPGGQVRVRMSDAGRVFLTGPAVRAFDGHVSMPA
ncbi:MAG: diaminopimelate epimerase [Planctomycetota bacterium]|jgi:diaminopimelate epimerase